MPMICKKCGNYMATCNCVKPRKTPSIRSLERMVFDGVAKATDGCKVEPDGYCPHGKPSWLIELGYI